METKGSYVAVGGFVVALALALVIFVVWLGQLSVSQATTTYVANFTSSINGLQAGSPVRFQGVPAGQVTSFEINPNNFNLVKVTMEIDADIPITQGSTAQLELAGITGGQYVEISGGAPGDPPIQSTGDGPPEIPTTPSTLEAISNELPQILDGVNTAVTQITTLLSDENIDNISATIANIRDISDQLDTQISALTGTGERINSLISNVDGLAEELRVDVVGITDRLDQLLSTTNTEIQNITESVQTATDSFSSAAGQASALLSQVRPGIVEFSQGGLYDLTLLITELRALAVNVNRVTEQLGNDPTQFLFGDNSQGVAPIR
jgi:phospholipid/cholesterol/gamma-HCH transport system substrate-binding protein